MRPLRTALAIAAALACVAPPARATDPPPPTPVDLALAARLPPIELEVHTPGVVRVGLFVPGQPIAAPFAAAQTCRERCVFRVPRAPYRLVLQPSDAPAARDGGQVDLSRVATPSIRLRVGTGAVAPGAVLLALGIAAAPAGIALIVAGAPPIICLWTCRSGDGGLVAGGVITALAGVTAIVAGAVLVRQSRTRLVGRAAVPVIAPALAAGGVQLTASGRF